MSPLDVPRDRKLANYEGEGRKIAAFEGVPALGLTSQPPGVRL